MGFHVFQVFVPWFWQGSLLFGRDSMQEIPCFFMSFCEIWRAFQAFHVAGTSESFHMSVYGAGQRWWWPHAELGATGPKQPLDGTKHVVLHNKKTTEAPQQAHPEQASTFISYRSHFFRIAALESASTSETCETFPCTFPFQSSTHPSLRVRRLNRVFPARPAEPAFHVRPRCARIPLSCCTCRV